MAPLTDFKFVDLSVDGDASAVEPQTVKELAPPKVFEFPLKGHYDLVNRTLGGMVEPPSLAIEGGPAQWIGRYSSLALAGGRYWSAGAGGRYWSAGSGRWRIVIWFSAGCDREGD